MQCIDLDTAGIEKALIGDDNISLEASEEFVNSTYVQELTKRALAYLEIGYPVHFAGPAGTGKTTLAFHVASKLGRPITLLHGDDEFGSSDLIGKDNGYRKHRLVDNYIHSVMKTEEEMKSIWVDNRLTTACRNGETLIYDEFTRSRPEANNALLSVLEEKILNLPRLRRTGEGYMEVHPDFRAIFTSNPEEYAGVHKTQDALMDRLITINLNHYDRETEIAITVAKSGLKETAAQLIVDLVRGLRSVGVNNYRPTIRASIIIAKVSSYLGCCVSLSDPNFQQICRDVLGSIDTTKISKNGKPLMPLKIEEIFNRVLDENSSLTKPKAKKTKPIP